MWHPSKLTTQQKEERCMDAARLLQEGNLSQAQIARRIGVDPQTVSRWASLLEAGGLEALHRRPRTGRKPHLNAQEWQQVLNTLQQGAQAAGFATERWTLTRIQSVILQKLGVRYNAHYLSERLRRLGWSVQKPAVYARERSDELVEAWLKGDWPRIQKKRASWGHK
jgi:transposase